MTEALHECWTRGWAVLVQSSEDGGFVAKIGPVDRPGRRFHLGYGNSEEAALRQAIRQARHA